MEKIYLFVWSEVLKDLSPITKLSVFQGLLPVNAVDQENL